MLWLCIALPQWPLEALHCEEQEQAVVITACEGSTRWIICCNEYAGRANLRAPMNYTVALAVHPQLVVFERRVRAEQAALERLAGWAYQFSSHVVPGEIFMDLRRARGATLWLEIGASLKLFGGLQSLVAQLEAGLQELGYTYLLGVGPTLEGAALLARAGIRKALRTHEALRSSIADLPLRMLALEPQITQQLHAAGIRDIGLILDLPRDGLARRFGPELSDMLARLTGERPDPRPAYVLPASYDAKLDFEFEVRSSEALLFPLRRMLRELGGFLRGRDTALQRFRIALDHRDAPATCLDIGISLAERDPDKLFELACEQLERIGLPTPAIGLRITADSFAAPGTLQADFFSNALRQSEELAHTLDRIAARLGEGRVHGLQCCADHRPEACWTAMAHGEIEPGAAAPRTTALQFPPRPLWLLPEPLRVSPDEWQSPSDGVERIESGWWESGDVRRDYYIVRTAAGARWWVYRDLQDQGWYLHGLWS